MSQSWENLQTDRRIDGRMDGKTAEGQTEPILQDSFDWGQGSNIAASG